MGILIYPNRMWKKMEAKEDVERLIKALKHKDWKVRWKAAEDLGKIGDTRAVEPLIQALKDEDWQVRNNVAWALGEIGDARAVEPLIQALKDEDWPIHQVPRKALEKIKAKKS
jgi:HEAT repeat protein